MKRFFVLLATLCTALGTPLPSIAQRTDTPQAYRGFPDHSGGRDLRSSFATPPKGYGSVPFFWFNGDTLNRERMAWELDLLKESATDGFSVSYIHLAPPVDSLEHEGEYGLFGHTEPGEPKIFSDAWWEFWNWFSAACAERDMATGLDDYTVGWLGNGYYPDEIYESPAYRDYQGKLVFSQDTAVAGSVFERTLPPHTVGVTAFRMTGAGIPIDLTEAARDGALRWETPADSDYTIYITATEADYLLHPDVGRDLVGVYFDRFEQRMDERARQGMNYFFQDELVYPLTPLSWCEDMKAEFLGRKGYDITPWLPALQYDMGARTAKIRIDYCDVLMTLAEERYFRPVFDWHNDRGLLYGCDNLGRGLDPLSYLDYFRATGWFTAPGNDAPARGSSFIQTKISSSVAHLYRRPRTWLEAFHSMGWGSKAEWLTEQIDHHFIAGGNLVCMHGLYYSTHGGWWEWAPPSFHFRMPYWPHMKKWLEYTERMSFLLSQGVHVCDIAVLYPTETLQAYGREEGENYDFSYVTELSDNGLDFDFIDNRSLMEAKIEGRRLKTVGEEYQVVFMKDIRALRHDALVKIRDHYRAGGAVVAVGALPGATDRTGANDPEVEKILLEVFGITAAQTETVAAKAQTNPLGGRGFYASSMRNLAQVIRRHILPDFIPGHSSGKVLHRRIGEQDAYMVMNVTPGTECFFRAHGKVELWDAASGTFTPMAATRVTGNGTYVRLEAPENRSSLVVFSPGEPLIDDTDFAVATTPPTVIPLEGEWEVEMLPTLDNRWGDFRLPRSEGMIGPEARSFRHAPLAGLPPKGWFAAGFDDSGWQEGLYGFGPGMEVLIDSSERSTGELVLLALNDRLKGWQPYDFSWQYGVCGEPGSQGYHGLKAKVDNDFLILDRRDRMFFRTRFLAPEAGPYLIRTGHTPPAQLFIDKLAPSDTLIELKKGWHELLVIFDPTQTLPLRMECHLLLDPRPRSGVVILPANNSGVEEITPYSDIVAMDWYRSAHLTYDTGGEVRQATAYRFETVPGLTALRIDITGRLEKAWVDGIEINMKRQVTMPAPGRYEITLPAKRERTGIAALQIEPAPGADGAAVFRRPVELICSTGLMKAGDWSENGSLRYYSGGMYYRKTVELTAEQIAGGVTLDLGEVSATCEIRINGQAAGVHIYSPFRSGITPLLEPGANRIEVLVYSTLANHYQTIPTPYKGEPEAGLTGPVRLLLGGE